METEHLPVHDGLTRRDFLGSGMALGGLAISGGVLGGAWPALAVAGQQCGINGCGYPLKDPQQALEYDYPNTLPEFTQDMQSNLGPDELRITFLGSGFPPARRSQEMMSIFVEVGPWVPDSRGGPGKATDSFVFDCGSGVIGNYNAMGISFGRMDKIFISHLHADHMSDLSAIYCFGPANDRKSPLYVWGQSASNVWSPAWGSNPRKQYNDGVKAFCKHLREAMRWHTESFSFLPTRYEGYQKPTRKSWGLPSSPVPVGDDPHDDGYALIPIELKWKKVGGVAYNNPSTGVKITHYPVIHTRKGSMGYKLEWNGLSLVYSSDTRPEWTSVQMASGVDVFIHEMILPPEVLTMKNMGLPAPEYANPAFQAGVQMSKTVIESSHSPQGSFGYLLSQINPRPRLTAIAHFPVANDTVACALNSVKAHFPEGDYPQLGRDIIWATDVMVLKVRKGGQIEQYRGKVSDLADGAPQNIPANLKRAKYHTADGEMDPTAQLDLRTLIPPTNADGTVNYCENGY